MEELTDAAKNHRHSDHQVHNPARKQRNSVSNASSTYKQSKKACATGWQAAQGREGWEKERAGLTKHSRNPLRMVFCFAHTALFSKLVS
jgi:hypothetical protein